MGGKIKKDQILLLSHNSETSVIYRLFFGGKLYTQTKKKKISGVPCPPVFRFDILNKVLDTFSESRYFFCEVPCFFELVCKGKRRNFCAVSNPNYEETKDIRGTGYR